MHSPTRVPFGLRDYATESESGSWTGSGLSDFPSDSDAESFCGEFTIDPNLPGFDPEVTESKKGTKQPVKKIPELPPPVKESWSEIDEKARSQEEKIKAKQQKMPNTTAPARHPKGHHRRSDSLCNLPPLNKVHTVCHSPLSRAEKSDCWRSKAPPRRRPERKRPDKR